KQKQLQNRVEFLPAQYGEAKQKLYQSACLFVLASQSENFANVVLEAMSYGCPVIVSKGVGLHQAVCKAKAGLVSERTPEQLAASISRLYNNPEERQEMAINGKKLVEREFSWNIVAQQMIKVYEEMQ
ncbi:MAG: glycosyltransferase family 4 protein, partial [bacterium]